MCFGCFEDDCREGNGKKRQEKIQKMMAMMVV